MVHTVLCMQEINESKLIKLSVQGYCLYIQLMLILRCMPETKVCSEYAAGTLL